MQFSQAGTKTNVMPRNRLDECGRVLAFGISCIILSLRFWNEETLLKQAQQ